LERQCDLCGINALPLLPEETAIEGSVRWSRFEYDDNPMYDFYLVKVTSAAISQMTTTALS